MNYFYAVVEYLYNFFVKWLEERKKYESSKFNNNFFS